MEYTIRFPRSTLLTLSVLLFQSIQSPATEQSKPSVTRPPAVSQNWPRFRGPDGSGISAATNVPLVWSDTENIAWKAELPGRGASSPIVWQDRVYVTAYTGYGLTEDDGADNRNKLRRHLLCFSLSDGRQLWRATYDGEFREHDVTKFLSLHGYASSSPAADATGVYVYFGAGGVIAFDHDGSERWRRDLGRGTHSWGTASSPILFENLLIVHADIEARRLFALDRISGREVWSVVTGDPKLGDSWSTPLVAYADGKPELVFHRSQGEPATLAAVDARSGALLWECQVLQDYLTPSPIAHTGVVYTIAYQKGAAIRLGGNGNVTDSHVLWAINKGSEVCTPIYHEGHLYWTSEEGGIAYCINAANGKTVYQERLRPEPGRIYASGVLAGQRIYYCSRESGTYVIAAKPKFELLAHNTIETDRTVFNGTPAIVDGHVILRSDQFLYCVGRMKK